MTVKEGALRSSGPVAVVAVVMLVLLPLLYVLSVGPAAWLYDRGMIGSRTEPVLQAIYAPLSWLVNTFPAVSQPIVWYADLWQTASPAPPPSAPLPPPPIPPTPPAPTPAPAAAPAAAPGGC